VEIHVVDSDDITTEALDEPSQVDRGGVDLDGAPGGCTRARSGHAVTLTTLVPILRAMASTTRITNNIETISTDPIAAALPNCPCSTQPSNRTVANWLPGLTRKIT